MPTESKMCHSWYVAPTLRSRSQMLSPKQMLSRSMSTSGWMRFLTRIGIVFSFQHGRSPFSILNDDVRTVTQCSPVVVNVYDATPPVSTSAGVPVGVGVS